MTPTLTVPRGPATLTQVIENSLTMAWRGLLRMRRTPEQFGDVLLQPVLFTLMFTYIFGGAVAGNVKSYLPFFVPGILVLSVITTSVVTGVQLREDMDKGVTDRFRSMPIARAAPLAGALLADTIRYAVATLMTFLTGFAIGWRPAGGITGVLLAGVLVIACSWAVSWIFALFGVIARTAATVQGLSFLILFPLTFLSNAFVPAKTLPGWLQGFVAVNPVSHLVTAARELTTTGGAGPDVWWALLGAVAIVAVFAPLTVRAYMRNA
jgi:ABC-2 type transport system permease protein